MKVVSCPVASWPGWGQLMAGIGFTGLGVLAAVAMIGYERRLKATGGPGIVPFELAGSAEKARAILSAWGAEGQAAARRILHVDYVFIVGYVGLLSVLAASTSSALADRTWDWMDDLGNAAAWLALAAGLCDVAENLLLASALNAGTQPDADIAPQATWARRFALTKFTLATAVTAWVTLVAVPIVILTSA